MAAYNLSQTARAKLADIYEYSFLNFGEGQADAYIDSLYETFDKLTALPYMGRAWRRWRRHEHGEHVIFYTVSGNHIEIVELFHHSENIVARMKS